MARPAQRAADAAPADPVPLVDVFISYSRHDAAIAQRLAQTLRAEGFEVWFDQHIRAGAKWETLLRGVLASAKAVLVIWSERSVKSRWVTLEAQIALKTRRLVPARIDDCTLPPGFDAIETALLPGWTGGDHAELQVLLAGLAALAPPSRVDTVRPGFDCGFLGVDIDLPAVPGVADEFPYLHFSVVMNPARRLAWYSAANLAPREVDVMRGDRWLPDPMLRDAFQPHDSHYRGTGYDRGHLTRARAVSWGPERLATLANRQAFFWTNTAPQHPEMNRHWWLAVEQWEDALLASHPRVSSFSGPALLPDDPVHGAMEQTVGRIRMRQSFRLPRAFWKLLVAQRDDASLATAAFWLDQTTLEAALARRHRVPPADLPGWRVDVATLERRTGLDFGAALRGARPLAAP
jgi:endonuclease G, mitochondrial